METNQVDNREAWQRGPVEGIPALLQPVAHSLFHTLEGVEEEMKDFPDELLWKRPAEVASVGFHLLHLTGVLDRLFTYARGEMLSQNQLKALAVEHDTQQGDKSAGDLVQAFRDQVALALVQLKHTDEKHLTDARSIGRKKIPTTVAGLLFHAAEHCQRHFGQLLVTSRVLRDN